MPDVTRILRGIESGDPSAAEQLLPLVYEELRRLAAAKMAQEKPGQTLQATALVHEAYIRLVDVEHAQQWDSRCHFFAAAAESMRRILVDHARRRNSQRHGGEYDRLDLLEIDVPIQSSGNEVLIVDDALTKLSNVRPEAATLVKMRLFCGLSNEEAALAIGVSARTARRLWVYARAWLRRELDPATNHNSEEPL